MSATATPTILPEPKILREDGRNITCSVIRGIPGGPPGEEFILLVKPDSQWAKGEIHADGEDRLRSWTTEKMFADSPNFPAGIDVGVTLYHTDTGVGQPFVERSVFQIGDDTVERLRCYAFGEPYLSITERRRLAKESAKYQQTKAAGRVQDPDAKNAEQALAALADDKLAAKIEKMVEQRVAAALAKAGAK